MANIVNGVPNIVVFAAGAFAVYWFFIKEDKDEEDEERRRRLVRVRI